MTEMPVRKANIKEITALWLTGFLAVFSLAALAAAWARGNFSLAAFTNLVALAATIAIFILIKRGHNTSAFILGLMATFFQMGLMQNLARSGTSFALSTMLVVIGLTYAILLLPAPAWGVVVSAVLGFITSCVDFWGPAARPVSDNQTDKLMVIFVGLLLAGVLVLILRLWKNLDFSTKMVISFIFAALIPVIISQTYQVFAPNSLVNNLGPLAADQQALAQAVKVNIQGIMLACSLGVSLASILGLFIASLITRQLRRMVKDVDEVVKTGNIRHEIQVDTEDEIGQLAVAMRRLMGYVQDKAEIAIRIAGGDLRVEVKPLSAQDVLGVSFKSMVSDLRQAIAQVHENANQLDTASKQLAEAAETAGEATGQIAKTMQQISYGITQEVESITRTSSSVDAMSRVISGVAHGAVDQAAAVNQTSQVTSRINTAIEQVILGIGEVSTHSTSAEDSARQGASIMQASLEGMQTIKNKVALSMEKVEEMGRQSENIGMIVETIADIASQTNMLALNAAIEAARAGEAGKGFSVVADEVRKLAERSANATREINTLVKNIQNTVGDAVAAMGESTREVDQGVTLSSSASAALDTILTANEKVSVQTSRVAGATDAMRQAADALIDSVEQVSAVVEQNTAATEEMSASSDEVVQAIENISSVSEENSAAVEEVSASSEEITAQVQEVASLAHAAANIADSLTGAVSHFKI